MAKGSGDTTRQDDLHPTFAFMFRCAVCHETFNNDHKPVSIGCRHNAGEKCFHRLFRPEFYNGRDWNLIRCPFCLYRKMECVTPFDHGRQVNKEVLAMALKGLPANLPPYRLAPDAPGCKTCNKLFYVCICTDEEKRIARMTAARDSLSKTLRSPIKKSPMKRVSLSKMATGKNEFDEKDEEQRMENEYRNEPKNEFDPSTTVKEEFPKHELPHTE